MRKIDLYLLNLHHLIRVHHYALNHSTRMRGPHYQRGFVNLPWTISNRSKCPGRGKALLATSFFKAFSTFFSSHFLSRLKISFSVCQQRWRHNTRPNNMLKNKNYSFQPDCWEFLKFVSGNSVVPSWYDDTILLRFGE